jgi:hypothetical protein
MRTDYQNINGFESLTIVFIIVGIFLAGTIIFSGLASKQQVKFVAALDILDAHEQVVQSLRGIGLIYDGQQEFFNQFYIAFTQVAVVNPDGLKISRDTLIAVYKSATNRVGQTSPPVIAGASVDREELTNIIPLEDSMNNDPGPPMDWSALKQNLAKLYKSQLQ